MFCFDRPIAFYAFNISFYHWPLYFRSDKTFQMQKSCIVIPCYNEEKRLPKEAYQEYLSSNGSTLCFVDDGSSDDTRNLLESIRQKFEDKVHVLGLEANSGKAEAVRQGVLYANNMAQFQYIAFMDADLATPLTEVERMLEQIRSGPKRKKVLIGSRVKRLGAKIERNLLRHYFGRVYATLASIMMDLPSYDTQCGAKVFSSDVVEDLFGESFNSKWLFDIELIKRTLAINPNTGMEGIIDEFPLMEWHEIGSSKIRLSDALKVPFILWKLRQIYRKR